MPANTTNPFDSLASSLSVSAAIHSPEICFALFAILAPQCRHFLRHLLVYLAPASTPFPTRSRPLQCSLNAISNAIDMLWPWLSVTCRFCLIMKTTLDLRLCGFLMSPHNMAGISSKDCLCPSCLILINMSAGDCLSSIRSVCQLGSKLWPDRLQGNRRCALKQSTNCRHRIYQWPKKKKKQKLEGKCR